MTERRIHNTPISSAIFRQATEAELVSILDEMSRYSLHFADDTGAEWPHAREALASAAAEINRLNLGAEAILALYYDRLQRFTFSKLLNAILIEARK
jgi:hypothetical protein